MNFIQFRGGRGGGSKIPSRRRSLWTLSTSLMAGPTAASGLLNEPPLVSRSLRGTHPAVREIHKNAWLKRQTFSVDKKATHFTGKKGEKFWVVFCVHDDSEAFLEFYAEPKMGALHKPLSSVSLNSCLHVSPSIVAGQDNEYQFAVTLQTEVIRLVAANWDQMIEWVESLQGKLREMNILSPKDNLYSKLPENTGPGKVISGQVASTRDPNSPLPPPPCSFVGDLGQSQQQSSQRSLVPSNQNSSIASIGISRTEQLNRRSATESSTFVNAREVTGESSHPLNTVTTASTIANSVTSRLSVNGNSSASLITGHHHPSDRENSSRTNQNNILVDLHSDSARTRGQASSSTSSPGETNGGSVRENSSNVSKPVGKRKQQISVKVSVDVVHNSLSGHERSSVSQVQRQDALPSPALGQPISTTVVVIGKGDARVQSNDGAEGSNEDRSSVTEVSTSSSSSLLLNGSCNDILVPTAANGQQVSHHQHHKSQNYGLENGITFASSSSPCVSRVAVNCANKVAKAKSSRIQQLPTNSLATCTNGDNHSEIVVSIESTVDSTRGNNGAVGALAKSKTKTVGSTKKSSSSENIYEHIYIPDGRPVVVERMRTNNGVQCKNGNNQQQQVNNMVSQQQQNESEITSRNNGVVHRSSSQRSPEEGCPSGSNRESHARRVIKGNNAGSSQRSSSLGRIELPPAISSRSTPSETVHHRLQDHRDHERPSRNNGNRNHSRQQQEQVIAPWSIGNSTFFANNGTPACHHTPPPFPTSPAQLQGNPLDALIGSRSGEYRLRRDDYLIRMGEANASSGSSGSGSDNDNHSSYHGSSSSSSNDSSGSQVNSGGHLPLKEQQVLHLQTEINHPGGVRVILRKKDCLNSIAFVDYLGGVWIAGWKQTQFPVLYYGFHVGDQILKVAGVNVQSSVEASRAIKAVSSTQVEFIIKRLPYGNVFALKRSRDGEPLGLVAEGGSGEISEVLPDGLAARYGLPPKGLSVDGQTPCNWYLTEVNNRPLSLMSKENEVKDRLNAVGKEISILVQPADLVKHLRKSLKSYKGFKDYVVG